MSSLYFLMGDFAKAGEVGTEALEPQERVLGKEHPNTLYTVSVLANVAHRKGKAAEALVLYKRAFEGLTKVRKGVKAMRSHLAVMAVLL